ncbi:MAG: heavy-metal-associated domain-containing protein [Marinilabiliaceae bacterium]|nr:heavy-metal-associated domain-containing protein [Marinilabiliaceae bacterium]
MKNVIRIITMIMLALATTIGMQAQEQEKKKDSKLTTVVLHSEISCNNCKQRIEKNIPFEKGVKDLKVSLADKTVTIVFRNDKNTSEKLCEAVTKLGYKSVIIKEK